MDFIFIFLLLFTGVLGRKGSKQDGPPSIIRNYNCRDVFFNLTFKLDHFVSKKVTHDILIYQGIFKSNFRYANDVKIFVFFN